MFRHTFQLCISDRGSLFVSTIPSRRCSLWMLMLSYGGGRECPKGFVGVNMFGAIMLDHLIMTRPSGSSACLLPTPPTTYADNTILPQCNSLLQISIKDGLNGYKDGLNGVLLLRVHGSRQRLMNFSIQHHVLCNFRSSQPTFWSFKRQANASWSYRAA